MKKSISKIVALVVTMTLLLGMILSYRLEQSMKLLKQ